MIDLPEVLGEVKTGAAAAPAPSHVFDKVQVGLTVVVGHTDTTIGALTGLKTGTVFKLDRTVDQPVDVLLDGQVIARGHLVAVDEQFGVIVSEVAQVLR